MVGIEAYSLTTQDGREEVFGSTTQDKINLMSWNGFASPPVQWITRRGYKQHGLTEIDYLLDAREIQIELFQTGNLNRETYWAERKRFIDLVRHNRGGPMILTIYLPDGSRRAIVVRANPGVALDRSTDDNNWSFNESLRLMAFDPIWYDPDTISSTQTASEQDNLVFPIEFPIWFGADGTAVSYDASAYAGNWRSYPVFTINGPYTWVEISNIEKGVSVLLQTAILAGETRIIDLASGAQSITDPEGNSHWDELDPSSNLVEMAIYPLEELGASTQTIQVTFNGGDDTINQFTLEYVERYIGI